MVAPQSTTQPARSCGCICGRARPKITTSSNTTQAATKMPTLQMPVIAMTM